MGGKDHRTSQNLEGKGYIRLQNGILGSIMGYLTHQRSFVASLQKFLCILVFLLGINFKLILHFIRLYGKDLIKQPFTSQIFHHSWH